MYGRGAGGMWQGRNFWNESGRLTRFFMCSLRPVWLPCRQVEVLQLGSQGQEEKDHVCLPARYALPFIV